MEQVLKSMDKLKDDLKSLETKLDATLKSMKTPDKSDAASIRSTSSASGSMTG